MIPAQKIDLLIQDQHKNPEDIATHQLLQISDEYSPDPFDVPHLALSSNLTWPNLIAFIPKGSKGLLIKAKT